MPRIQFVTSFASPEVSFQVGKQYDVDEEAAEFYVGHLLAKDVVAPAPVPATEKPLKRKTKAHELGSIDS